MDDLDARIQEIRLKVHGEREAISQVWSMQGAALVKKLLGLAQSMLDNANDCLGDDELEVMRTIGAEASSLDVTEGLVQGAKEIREWAAGAIKKSL